MGVALVCPSIAAGAQHLLQLGILCFLWGKKHPWIPTFWQPQGVDPEWSHWKSTGSSLPESAMLVNCSQLGWLWSAWLQPLWLAWVFNCCIQFGGQILWKIQGFHLFKHGQNCLGGPNVSSRNLEAQCGGHSFHKPGCWASFLPIWPSAESLLGNQLLSTNGSWQQQHQWSKLQSSDGKLGRSLNVYACM